MIIEDFAQFGRETLVVEKLDLINQLAEVPELRVTGKTSAFSFKGTDATIPEIGESLNVAHVLDGSVSKSGDRVRISVVGRVGQQVGRQGQNLCPANGRPPGQAALVRDL